MVPLNATLPADDGTRLAVRIGLHTGPVVIADVHEQADPTGSVRHGRDFADRLDERTLPRPSR